jgi:hypothetical protein
MRHRITRRLTILGATIALALAAPLGVALAAHFNDVPNSSPYHGDISALAATGVTVGCGNNNFCPKANVTREQMAAFMNRLGALGPGKTPVVNAKTAQTASNADRLDALDSTAFRRFGASAPPNSLQTGTFVIGDGNGNEIPFSFISYPVPVATPLTAHVIQPGDPVPAGCSGSVTAPNASAGHVCLFVGFNNNIASIGTFSPYTGGGGTGREGVVMNATFDAPAIVAVATGTWAARAPLSAAAPEVPAPSGPNIVGD